jgi:hypothetical protein
MATTYEPIATTTLGSAASSITFSSIPATYTDLRLVTVQLEGGYPVFSFNGVQGGTSYSQTVLTGNGSAASSTNYTNMYGIIGGYSAYNSATIPTLYTLDVFSYAGSTNKTCLISISNDKNGSGVTEYEVGLWRNTAAITSIVMAAATTFNAGTTATLYGIKNA